MLYVRQERRPYASAEERLFVVARDRNIYHYWYPLGPMPAEFELVHDVAGRAEAELVRLGFLVLERERDAMLAAMKRAVAMLDNESAQEVRRVYREKMK